MCEKEREGWGGGAVPWNATAGKNKYFKSNIYPGGSLIGFHLQIPLYTSFQGLGRVINLHLVLQVYPQIISLYKSSERLRNEGTF